MFFFFLTLSHYSVVLLPARALPPVLPAHGLRDAAPAASHWLLLVRRYQFPVGRGGPVGVVSDELHDVPLDVPVWERLLFADRDVRGVPGGVPDVVVRGDVAKVHGGDDE